VDLDGALDQGIELRELPELGQAPVRLREVVRRSGTAMAGLVERLLPQIERLLPVAVLLQLSGLRPQVGQLRRSESG